MLGKRSLLVRHHLEKHGVAATATVLEIAADGTSVTTGNGSTFNTEAVRKTRLRVEPASGPAFEVDQRFRFPDFAIPAVGARLAVLYDPDDHDKVMVDPAAPVVAAPVAFAAPDPITQLERLVRLRDAGALTPEEFAAQKARLLG